MKKYPFLWMLVLFVLLSVYNKDESKIPLTNTIWQSIKNEGRIHSLIFKNDICFYTLSDQQTRTLARARYSYSFHYPSILFISRESGIPFLKGHISGKTLNLIDENTQKVIAVLIKQ